MKAGVTGASGFLGWHARCAFKAAGIECVPIDRRMLGDPTELGAGLDGVNVVLHAAGVNRGRESDLRDNNMAIAKVLTSALDRLSSNPPLIIYANSLHSGDGTAFGDGKESAAAHLAAWGMSAGAPVADVRLPNLFGEHGRPFYNSVVATFCHQLATGGTPVVFDDRALPLLHVQDAMDVIIDLAQQGFSGVVRPSSTEVGISEVLRVLETHNSLYSRSEIPDLTEPLHLALFNTYRSYCFLDRFPTVIAPRSDARGALFECLRGFGGQTQVFCSSTHPGALRGNHFHRRKIERFIVLGGTAEIALRRLFGDTVTRFTVSGNSPSIVDMPTMWAHSIENVGAHEMSALFWASEIFDPAHADTFPEPVLVGNDGTDGHL